MPKKHTLEEIKESICNVHGNKYDTKLIDISLVSVAKQRLICNTLNAKHTESKLFSQVEGKVVFSVLLNNLINKGSGCPVCAEASRIKTRTNDDEYVKNLIANHPNNTVGPTGQKTILISEYKGRSYDHTFKCGLCNCEFTRKMDDILRSDRKPRCGECAMKEKQELFKITMEEANRRIEERFGKDSIEINDSVIENVKTPMNFYCYKCKKVFVKTLGDLLVSKGCNLCLPWGYSKKAIEWMNTFEEKIQHAENGGEYSLGAKKWADGYCKNTNTVYEFHGCDFHGHIIGNLSCGRCSDPCQLNPYGVPYVDVYRKTSEKKNYILSLGYNLIEIWECEFDRLKKQT